MQSLTISIVAALLVITALYVAATEAAKEFVYRRARVIAAVNGTGSVIIRYAENHKHSGGINC